GQRLYTGGRDTVSGSIEVRTHAALVGWWWQVLFSKDEGSDDNVTQAAPPSTSACWLRADVEQGRPDFAF
ncbi:hypothetical protein, partial [Bradyrhizobium valentinum]|uniref:hypothetical protein n=1 Tax=Bradyrhizobium valentinum TaxID=1518501 RepID=UPI001AEC9027